MLWIWKPFGLLDLVLPHDDLTEGQVIYKDVQPLIVFAQKLPNPSTPQNTMSISGQYKKCFLLHISHQKQHNLNRYKQPFNFAINVQVKYTVTK